MREATFPKTRVLATDTFDGADLAHPRQMLLQNAHVEWDRSSERLGLDSPEWIVAAFPEPGRPSLGRLERLRLAHPLARPLAIVGSWRMSERRTPFVCHGWTTIRWDTASAWFSHPEWSTSQSLQDLCLPTLRTRTLEERQLSRSPNMARKAVSMGSLAQAYAETREELESLIDLLESVGLSASRTNRRGAIGVVSVSDYRKPESRERVQQWLRLNRVSNWGLVANFLREDEYSAAIQDGATFALNKPILAHDLVMALSSLDR